MNRRAKFDAASFIFDGEIRNRSNAQTNKKTNSNRYIHTLPIEKLAVFCERSAPTHGLSDSKLQNIRQLDYSTVCSHVNARAMSVRC